MKRKRRKWLLIGSMQKNSKKLFYKREDHRKLKYYNQLLKKHEFWDKQPTLRDDMKQI